MTSTSIPIKSFPNDITEETMCGAFAFYEGTAVGIPVEAHDGKKFVDDITTEALKTLVSLMRSGSTLKEVKEIIKKRLDIMSKAYKEAVKDTEDWKLVQCEDYFKDTNIMAKSIGIDSSVKSAGITLFALYVAMAVKVKAIPEDNENGFLILSKKSKAS